MSTVDYDINLYRRRYFKNHPEKRMQYRTNEAVSFLIRNYGPQGAVQLIEERAAHGACAGHGQGAS